MECLRTTTDIVRYMLLMYPNTREDDHYLYYRVLKFIGERKGIKIDSVSVEEFFLKLSGYEFPSIESVGRCRRKLQEKYPEFVGSQESCNRRKANEKKYRAYARGGV